MPLSFTHAPKWLQTPSVDPGLQDIANGNAGPYEFSTKLYWVYNEVLHGTPDTFQLVAYRSDDQGQSQPMTRIAPGSPITNTDTATAVSCTGNVIYVSFQTLVSTTVHVKAVTFDMSTETWGTVNDTGISFASSATYATTFPILRANGDLVVMYDLNNAVKAVIFSSGVWSAAITIGSGTHPFPLISANNISSGNIGIWWSDGTDIQFCVLAGSTPTNTSVTTQLDIITNNPIRTQQLPFATIYDSTSDTAAWIYLKNLHPDMGVYVASVSPSSTPTPTVTLIYQDVGDAIELLNPTLAGNSTGDVFVTLLWSVTQDTKLLILQGTSLTVGPWTGPATYYDAGVNPPSPAPSSTANLFPSFSRFLSNGVLANTSNFLPPSGSTSDAVDTPATMIPFSQTLRLVKSVSGGTALPAMWLLTGTGPTTISGAGDTGEVVAPSGTYVLTESVGPDGYTAGPWVCTGGVQSGNNITVGPAVSAVQVPSANTYRQFLSSEGPYVFQVSTNLYQVLVSPTTGKVGIFKRSVLDIGLGWTEKNAAGSPDQGNHSGYGRALYNSGTGLITIAYLLSGQVQMKLCSFDTATDTWGAATSSITVESILSTFAFGQQAGGLFVIVGGGVNHLYYFTNNSGTWSAITNLILNPTRVFDGVMDAGDRMHLLINSTSLACEYRTLPSTFVLSSPQSVASSTSLTEGGYPSICLWGSTAIAIAYVDQHGPNIGKLQVQTGTPLAAPVLSGGFIVFSPIGTSITFPRVAVDGSGALNAFFVNIDYGIPEDRVMQSTFDGVSVWSASSVFYDAVASPPANGATPATSQAIQCLQPLNLSAGWVAGAAMQTTSPSLATTGEFLETGAAGAVVCTITNTFGAPPFLATCPSPVYTVGVPYSSFVIVTGGTGPFTFAVHSGSLPTGLSLNTSTGEISGTPSAAGPFTFVIRVTDSLGAIADTPNCPAGRCTGSVSLL